MNPSKIRKKELTQDVSEAREKEITDIELIKDEEQWSVVARKYEEQLGVVASSPLKLARSLSLAEESEKGSSSSDNGASSSTNISEETQIPTTFLANLETNISSLAEERPGYSTPTNERDEDLAGFATPTGQSTYNSDLGHYAPARSHSNFHSEQTDLEGAIWATRIAYERIMNANEEDDEENSDNSGFSTPTNEIFENLEGLTTPTGQSTYNSDLGHYAPARSHNNFRSEQRNLEGDRGVSMVVYQRIITTTEEEDDSDISGFSTPTSEIFENLEGFATPTHQQTHSFALGHYAPARNPSNLDRSAHLDGAAVRLSAAIANYRINHATEEDEAANFMHQPAAPRLPTLSLTQLANSLGRLQDSDYEEDEDDNFSEISELQEILPLGDDSTTDMSSEY